MKKLSGALLLMAAMLPLASCEPGEGPGGGGGNKVIYVDGGGDIANFNSTASMVESVANPYPYNTLEKLLKEWSDAHPGYTAKLNKTSSAGDRSVLLPQLQTHSAPHIIYQNGTVLSTDIGQDYYVPLKQYLEAPDPYLPNNAPWKTVYNQAELATTMASDGDFYYANMEKIPVAFVYNKDMLHDAGVAKPEDITTFEEFLTALGKVDTLLRTTSNEKWSNSGKYATEYTWYQIAMEATIFADIVEKGDVLRVNGNVDMEEMCRLYRLGGYKPQEGLVKKSGSSDFDPVSSDFSNNRLYDYINCIKRLDQYKEPATFSARQQFVAGKLAYMEVTGNLLRTLNSMNLQFNWDTICFPDITSETLPYITKGCVRGTAGLATSYWISNRAMDDGTEDMCADLLMFLTAPEQNNRMVGDLKGGIPLNPGSDYQMASYLTPLVEKYDEDVAAGNRVCWAAFNTWGNLGTNYQTLFITTMQKLDLNILSGNGDEFAKEATCILAKSLNSTITAYIIEQDYDESEWPALD